MTPTSVVPPPMSTTIEPEASRHRQAGADGRGHRLLDQVDVATRRRRAPIRGSRGARPGCEPQGTQMMMRGLGPQHRARVHHLDELLEHLLGDGEVGDHAVLHRPDGLDVAGHLAEHGLGFLADGLDGLLAVAGRLRGGWRRPRARRARCPCRARRSACWRCRGRWRGRWRNSGAGIANMVRGVWRAGARAAWRVARRCDRDGAGPVG